MLAVYLIVYVDCLTDINTFSENFDTVCAESSKWQFVHDLDSAARERWILCEHCLLWYHESCVYYTKGRSLPLRWFCGCMKQPECIWYCDDDIHKSIHFGFLGLYINPVTCFHTSRILLPCVVCFHQFLVCHFFVAKKAKHPKKNTQLY